MRQSSLSTAYLRYKVTVAADPTGDAVAFAFTTSNTPPGSGDWLTGSWEAYASGSAVARILIGPANGGHVLAVGSWIPWMRISDNPEVPVFELPTITILP